MLQHVSLGGATESRLRWDVRNVEERAAAVREERTRGGDRTAQHKTRNIKETQSLYGNTWTCHNRRESKLGNNDATE